MVFSIAILGYLLGNITVAGLQLGSAGVLLVALVFGHYGYVVPKDLQNFGLICFVASVGLLAGPTFFGNFKKKAFAYIFLGFFVVAVGAVVTGISLMLFDIPLDITLGIFTGAMTSTPGLGAATEVVGQAASAGYAIAYPFGVVGVVLFVQCVPKLLKADMSREVAKITMAPAENDEEGTTQPKKAMIEIESSGLAAFSITVVLGLLIAMISIPLPGGTRFSLGSAGGPLIAGLIIGHLRGIKKISLQPPSAALELLRELGLILFLMGAGTDGGQSFVSALAEHGMVLFCVGVAITVIPMILAYLISCTFLRLDMLNCLGSICGGMTSTPALGTLISIAKSKEAVAPYAATYPIALLMVILSTQVLALIFGS